MSTYLYIIIPIVVVAFTLKCCLLFWRIFYCQQRGQQQHQELITRQRNVIIREHQARACAQLRAAGGCGLTRIVARGQDGRERIYIVPTASLNQQGQRVHPVQPTHNPSAPSVSGTTTIVITPKDHLIGATGHRFNPNMPPSYDQAVTGRDKSLKVEEGTASVPINVPTNEETIPPP